VHIVCYSITSRQSFERAFDLLNQIERIELEKSVIVVVGQYNFPISALC